jgi:hypothetical protein
MPKWTTKAFIDDALGARDIVVLTNLIRDEELPPEVRQHLSNTIHGLLTGSLKFPRRRPPKKGLYWEKQKIAEKVWRAKKYNGWKKISSAVDHVAAELKCSPKKVWECWRIFDPIRYELQQEKNEFDFLMNAAYEARAEAAIEWLKESEGDREFTDEEIQDAANELDAALQAWASDDDY